MGFRAFLVMDNTVARQVMAGNGRKKFIASSRGMTGNARKSKVAPVPPSTERKLPLYPRQLRRSSNFFPKSAPKCQLLMKGQNKGRKNFLIFEGVKFLMCFAQCRCSPMLTDAHRCLPDHLDGHDVKRAETHGCQFRPIPAMLT